MSVKEEMDRRMEPSGLNCRMACRRSRRSPGRQGMTPAHGGLAGRGAGGLFFFAEGTGGDRAERTIGNLATVQSTGVKTELLRGLRPITWSSAH